MSVISEFELSNEKLEEINKELGNISLNAENIELVNEISNTIQEKLSSVYKDNVFGYMRNMTEREKELHRQMLENISEDTGIDVWDGSGD